MSARLRRGGPLAAFLLSALFATLPAPVRAQTCSTLSVPAWSTYLGGDREDVVEDLQFHAKVDKDDQDALFTVGRTSSTRFSRSGSGMPANSDDNVFLSKLSADGKTVLWSRVLGSLKKDAGARVALTASGEAYVVGQVAAGGVSFDSGANVPTVPGNIYQGGTTDAFLARVDAAGTPRWLLFLGGAGADEALGVAVEGGKVYVVGRTNSLTLNGAMQTFGTSGDGQDGFIAQVDVSSAANPTVTWIRRVGTSNALGLPLAAGADDAAFAVLASGNDVYVGGVVQGDLEKADPLSWGKLTRNAFPGGASAGFVLRLNAAGEPKWFVYLGGTRDTQVSDLLRRSTGDLVAVGQTSATNYPQAQPGFQTLDVFAQMVDRESGDLSSVWTRLEAPGAQSTRGRAAIDAANRVFLGGMTDMGSFAPDVMGRGFNATFTPEGGEGFVLALGALLESSRWGAYVGGNSPTPESVRALALDATGTWLFLGGNSSARELLRGDVGDKGTAPEGANGFVFGVRQDFSPPTAGQVEASVDSRGHLTATWSGFTDDESGITAYEWSILDSKQNPVLDFSPVNDKHASAEDLGGGPGEQYVVRVRATNGLGCSVTVAASALAGEDPASGAPGPGMQGPLSSPLGWGCGGAPAGDPLAAGGLVLLGLLGARRARRDG